MSTAVGWDIAGFRLKADFLCCSLLFFIMAESLESNMVAADFRAESQATQANEWLLDEMETVDLHCLG